MGSGWIGENNSKRGNFIGIRHQDKCFLTLCFLSEIPHESAIGNFLRHPRPKRIFSEAIWLLLFPSSGNKIAVNALDKDGRSSDLFQCPCVFGRGHFAIHLTLSWASTIFSFPSLVHLSSVPPSPLSCGFQIKALWWWFETRLCTTHHFRFKHWKKCWWSEPAKEFEDVSKWWFDRGD